MVWRKDDIHQVLHLLQNVSINGFKSEKALAAGLKDISKLIQLLSEKKTRLSLGHIYVYFVRRQLSTYNLSET